MYILNKIVASRRHIFEKGDTYKIKASVLKRELAKYFLVSASIALYVALYALRDVDISGLGKFGVWAVVTSVFMAFISMDITTTNTAFVTINSKELYITGFPLQTPRNYFWTELDQIVIGHVTKPGWKRTEYFHGIKLRYRVEGASKKRYEAIKLEHLENNEKLIEEILSYAQKAGVEIHDLRS